MGAVPFQDLPIAQDTPWDPRGIGKNALMAEVLGDPPDWDRYKKAHLWFDSENSEARAAYKLPIARMVDGDLKVILPQVSAAIAAINGARGGANIPESDISRVYNSAVKYLKKGGIESDGIPELKLGRNATFSMKVNSVDLVSSDNAPRWVHVATEGEYKGYEGGERPFSFTREIFNQVVKNLHNHPAFAYGADGLGKNDVIPWDFHHASEMYPTDGNIPFIGAPATGWTRDLEVRTSSDGKAQLWAFTIFMEPAKTYIKENKYRWASVSLVFKDVDAKTGEEIGARITSIAITNQPFIEGMNQLVASKKTEGIKSSFYYADPAGTAEEAFTSIRNLFALPLTSTIIDVMNEVSKLESWIRNGTKPLGVNMEEILGGMRKILNMAALKSEIEVIDEAKKMVTRLLEEQSGQSGINQIVPMNSGDNKTEETMDLLQKLSKAFGVRVSEDDVIAAAAELVRLRDESKEILGAEKMTVESILGAAKQSANKTKALDAIVQALSASNVDAAVARATDLLAKEKNLSEIQPKLERLEKDETERSEKQAESDVNDVLSTRRLPDSVRPALLMFRKNDPSKFAATYPRIDASKAMLTRDVTTRNGAELSVASGDKLEPSRSGDVIDLSKYNGVNKMQRAISYLRATRQDMPQMTWEAQCTAAMDLIRRENVVDSVNDGVDA